MVGVNLSAVLDGGKGSGAVCLLRNDHARSLCHFAMAIATLSSLCQHTVSSKCSARYRASMPEHRTSFLCWI